MTSVASNTILYQEILEKTYKKERTRHLVLSILYFLIVLSLFLFSGKNYWIQMFLCILLTCLYGCYTVYLFSNPLHQTQKSLHLIHQIRASNIDELYGTLLCYESHTKEGVSGYKMLFLKSDGKERELFDPFGDFTKIPLNSKCKVEFGAGCALLIVYDEEDTL